MDGTDDIDCYESVYCCDEQTVREPGDEEGNEHGGAGS